MDFKVTSCRDRFYTWEKLSQELKSLQSIVQNDMIISDKDIKVWKEKYSKLRNDMDVLYMDTIKYLVKDTNV